MAWREVLTTTPKQQPDANTLALAQAITGLLAALMRQLKGGNAVSIPASIAACVVLFKSCAGPQIQEQIRPLVETVVDQEVAVLCQRQDLARSNRTEVVWERLREFDRRLTAHEARAQ